MNTMNSVDIVISRCVYRESHSLELIKSALSDPSVLFSSTWASAKLMHSKTIFFNTERMFERLRDEFIINLLSNSTYPNYEE